MQKKVSTMAGACNKFKELTVEDRVKTTTTVSDACYMFML